MPLQATSGAASYDAFGGGAAVGPTYIEDVFSTWLYTGTNSTQTINNGIDLSGKGGMVWLKPRNWATSHMLFDTSRGTGKILYSDAAAAQATDNNSLTAFNANGFTLGTSNQGNASPYNFVGWTFREQPKFFDIVTWTGNNAAGRQIAHNLQSTPGCIIVKGINDSIDWFVYHRGATVGSPAASQRGYLNSTTFFQNDTAAWNDTAPTSTNFTVGTTLNNSNYTYVAYIFAHNAGGFGLTGTDNVITCGSYVGNGSTSNTVTLGYEPQWLLIKGSDTNAAWMLFDVMRGMPVSPGGAAPTDSALRANSSDAETTAVSFLNPTATGFELTISSNETNADGNTYIYIAIRRGPMKTPTTGTSVYNGIARTGTGTNTTISGVGFTPDLAVVKIRNTVDTPQWGSRLTGNRYLKSSRTDGETSGDLQPNPWDTMNGLNVANLGGWNSNGDTFANWFFRRAPGFMDVICYTGAGGGTSSQIPHNLGIAPELVIVKGRNIVTSWPVLAASRGANRFTTLNQTNAENTNTSLFDNTLPTATTLFLGANSTTNGTGNYIAYLFASCPGVSKVGSYTGNGSSQTIDMGFTGGARFFLVKRTDSTGDWWVYDSARGIVSAEDPALRLNSTAAEVTSADAVDTNSTGLIVNQEGTCNINVSSATYIYLGIA